MMPTTVNPSRDLLDRCKAAVPGYATLVALEAVLAERTAAGADDVKQAIAVTAAVRAGTGTLCRAGQCRQ
jgi:hypothetical protein